MTVAGPFGTLEAMEPAARAAYWFGSNLVAYALSMAVIGGAFRSRGLAALPMLARGLLGAAAFTLLFAAFLLAVRRAVFAPAVSVADYAELLLFIGPAAAGITGVVWMFLRRAPEAPPAPAAPRFLKRLRPGLGSRLIRLSMQDHYVEAVTDRGAQLILMRFADALEELDGAPGWRIHRSHWVAEAGLAGLRRKGDKAVATTTDGAELPVSRTYMPALREAGLFARFR